jgi:putative membrane protein
MLNILIRLAVCAIAVVGVQYVFDRLAPPDWRLITVADWSAAIIFAIVLGVLNALLRPLLLLVTCPINVLTLGLFTFVVNAVVFWVAAQLVPGIDVSGFLGALVGSLAVTICTSIVDGYLEGRR